MTSQQISRDDYQNIIAHVRWLFDIDGWDVEQVFDYLIAPWKWEGEREAWLERGREQSGASVDLTARHQEEHAFKRSF